MVAERGWSAESGILVHIWSATELPPNMANTTKYYTVTFQHKTVEIEY